MHCTLHLYGSPSKKSYYRHSCCLSLTDWLVRVTAATGAAAAAMLLLVLLLLHSEPLLVWGILDVRQHATACHDVRPPREAQGTLILGLSGWLSNQVVQVHLHNCSSRQQGIDWLYWLYINQKRLASLQMLNVSICCRVMMPSVDQVTHALRLLHTVCARNGPHVHISHQVTVT